MSHAQESDEVPTEGWGVVDVDYVDGNCCDLTCNLLTKDAIRKHNGQWRAAFIRQKDWTRPSGMPGSWNLDRADPTDPTWVPFTQEELKKENDIESRKFWRFAKKIKVAHVRKKAKRLQKKRLKLMRKVCIYMLMYVCKRSMQI